MQSSALAALRMMNDAEVTKDLSKEVKIRGSGEFWKEQPSHGHWSDTVHINNMSLTLTKYKAMQREDKEFLAPQVL